MCPGVRFKIRMNLPSDSLHIKAVKAALKEEKAENDALRITIAMLEQRVAALKDLEAAHATLEQRIAQLEEELRLLRARQYGPSSEKRKDRTFNEAEQVAANDEGEDEDESGDESAEAHDPGHVVPDTGLPARDKQKKPGKKRGRKPISPDLKRVTVAYELEGEERLCSCCQEQMHRMGETATEQVHIEIKIVVRKNVRGKYACRNCERTGTGNLVVLTPMPPQPLPGSVATASTLAWVLASKFVDGMPLYRMSSALKRADVEISRGTLGHWVIQSSERHLQRIYDVLHERLRGQNYIHGDETRVQVLKEDGREAEDQSYMWVYRNVDGSTEPIVLFDYQPGRGKIHPQAFLGNFSGTLMSDGYKAWRSAFPDATQLGCLAHVRRKFTDTVKANKKPGKLAAEALALIGALYDVEYLAREGNPGELSRDDYILHMRQQHSVPLLEAFKKWLEEKEPQVLPSSILGQAISYTLNQWDHLILYTSDPRAPIDNNAVEREIKNFVVGRKGWLFSDTVRGATASAVIYSLALTCRACGVNPQAWLAHALTQLPCRGPDADLEDLLPWNFVAAENSG